MSSTRRNAGIDRAARCLSLAVTSGKGGVGKTTTVVNLALALSKIGLRVTIIDGDMGLANLDVLLGITPRKTLEHFFREATPIEDIVVDGPHGLRIVPAGSGLPQLTRLSSEELIRFAESMDALRSDTDVLLVDTPAGISDQVSRLVMLCDRTLLITWPEPTALVDAYASLKVARTKRPDASMGLVINGAADRAEAERVHRQIDTAAERFLGRGIPLDGYVVKDEAIAHAARKQCAVVLTSPLAAASRDFERLAMKVASLAGARMRGLPAPGTPERQHKDLVH